MCHRLPPMSTIVWAGSEFVATARVLGVTSTSAVIGAELTDERQGLIASASVVVQFVKDISRYT
jgi:acyl-coenzyme A thioesterase PaaI-like protein